MVVWYKKYTWVPRRTKNKMNLNQQLKKYFGHDEFRPNQKEIIESVLAGNDTLAVLPTGMGKSICFQLTAMILPGLTIVISPLISLMKDHNDGLSKKGIPSAAYNSNLKPPEKRQILRDLATGLIKILYISAEGIQSEELLNFLKSLNISLIAHDECHVGSEWSQDFRPAYGKLGRLRVHFPSVPVIGVTATATPIVRNDIIRLLAMRQPNTFIAPVDRSNLRIEVRGSYGMFNDISNVPLNNHDGANIVYCITKKQTIELAQYVKMIGMGTADYYHGESSTKNKEHRRRVQEGFMSGKIKTVFATTAFGMGIDKDNVRIVVHMGISKTMENYVQETGRAGRDGKLSQCVMFWDESSINSWEKIILQKTSWKKEATNDEVKEKMKSRERQKDALRKVVNYVEADVCRRITILDHFGESHTGNCGKCDVCL